MLVCWERVHVLGLVCGNLFQELGPGSDETIMIICFEIPQLRKKAGDHVEGLLGELFIAASTKDTANNINDAVALSAGWRYMGEVIMRTQNRNHG